MIIHRIFYINNIPCIAAAGNASYKSTSIRVIYTSRCICIFNVYIAFIVAGLLAGNSTCRRTFNISSRIAIYNMHFTVIRGCKPPTYTTTTFTSYFTFGIRFFDADISIKITNI
jgi:hypothetical protein